MRVRVAAIVLAGLVLQLLQVAMALADDGCGPYPVGC